MLIPASRPTPIAGRYALQDRRKRFGNVVGILSNKTGSFVLVLNNDEIGSPRKFHAATRRVRGWERTGAHPRSEAVLIDGVLDILKTWSETGYPTVRMVPHGTHIVRDVVGTVDYLSWRLTLVYGSSLTKIESGVRGRMEAQPRTYSDEPFVWDGKGSWDIVAAKPHVHNRNGKCIKNRYGDRCS